MPPSRDISRANTSDEAAQDSSNRIVELSPSSDDGNEYFDGIPFPGSHLKKSSSKPLPNWLSGPQFSLIHDDLETKTSHDQRKTLDECLQLLTLDDTQGLELNTHEIPRLRKDAHAGFLRNTLTPLPSGYVLIDASRPWFFYWSMAGLACLGEDVSYYKQRLQETVAPLQNPSGGFGGGHGQLSHCAATYATTLALACVDGLDMIDRQAMWHWLGTVKQSDGGFRMSVNAEEDIRGAYCAMTVIVLLNLPLELPPDAPARSAGLTRFTDHLGEWIGACQTHEGGMAGAPTNEAHGAYAFCALACLCILNAPHVSIPKYLDTQALARCLASLQTTPEGGFAGRTNKLVDACYSHWVGGCWALLQAALIGTSQLHEGEDLWNREALIRYLLCCGQQPGRKGGMRDKPSTRPDGYHTCYSLAGLSAAMNHYHYKSGQPTNDKDSGRLLSAFNWTGQRASEEERNRWKVDESDIVGFVHPVFVIPFASVERSRKQFEKGGF
ncbi:terpenoid cyclases/Protein prenyltransferase [Polychaeton citri CBS 116435]|uniref:Terpenoid cyclases/Protein prenyltransferase n=1 Tax=Polychaeton citri CBS 116435 TaxID=1314669 RepID=A0A9P4Q1Y4_9PEZI|nr:terpenoid cyclases/Protein prenyltransferase [Polychaeton citri CBS 116435]